MQIVQSVRRKEPVLPYSAALRSGAAHTEKITSGVIMEQICNPGMREVEIMCYCRH
jgi:hypothetical protein